MQRAIDGYRNLTLPNTHDLAECLKMQADHLLQTNQFANAEPYYVECMNLSGSLTVPESLEIREGLAICYFQQRKLDKAKTLYEGLLSAYLPFPAHAGHVQFLRSQLAKCRS